MDDIGELCFGELGMGETMNKTLLRMVASATAYDYLPEFEQMQSGGDSDTQWLPVTALRPADSPRRAGEDIGHIEMLASIEERLPPIVVHRASMRVIDGMHRLRAAKLRGDDRVEVRFFDGDEQEAFVLAVTANTTHGLPLSIGDRALATERIIASQPTWSDRAIAVAVGLGARTVGNIRRRMQDQAEVESVTARTGRDGRVRPVDNSVGRLRASALIKQRPEASLREIAREAGVSPSTVRDVRLRLERGEDPLPQMRQRREKPAIREASRSCCRGCRATRRSGSPSRAGSCCGGSIRGRSGPRSGPRSSTRCRRTAPTSSPTWRGPAPTSGNRSPRNSSSAPRVRPDPVPGHAAGQAVMSVTTPVYKGLTDKKSMADWPDDIIKLNRSWVSKDDDAYWQKYKASPKFFINLETAHKLWEAPSAI